MSIFHQGDVVRDYLTLLDPAGDPILNATWATLQTDDPDEEDFFLSVDHIGNGTYKVEFTANKAGTYYFSITTVGLTPEQVFENTIAVDALGVSGAVIGTAAYGPTLDELIEMTATRLGDFKKIIATDNGAADGTSFIDNFRLAAIPSASLKGANLTIVSPTDSPNYQYQTRVKDSSESSTLLTLEPGFPSIVLTGTVAQLTNLQSRGFWRSQYVDAINVAQSDAFPNHLVPLSYTYPVAFTDQDPVIPLPTHVTHVHTVQAWDAYGDIRTIPGADQNSPLSHGWTFNEATGRITIGYPYLHEIVGRHIHLLGYGRPAPLVNPTDRTTVDAQWIAERAANLLRLGMGDQKRLAEASMFENQADRDILKIITFTEPGTIRVR